LVEAVMIFRDEDCGAIPVVADGQPIGVVTDRDVALALGDFLDKTPDQPVKAIMTRGVVTVTPDATLEEVRAEMERWQVRRVVVIDEAGAIAGIISLADLFPAVPFRASGETATRIVQG
jgi:CBS domain-containing protein